MENKELKMKLGQIQGEISKTFLPVSASLSNEAIWGGTAQISTIFSK